MASTSIFFDGQVISVPGSYSEVDASGLDQVGLTASGIVAVLGTAEGGIPVSALTKASAIPRFTRPDKMQKSFRSGDLLEVTGMLFSPSKDPGIQGGAQQVLVLKANPATQATASLQASSVNQIDLTSDDYGAFTDQINVEVAAGTDQGKKITVTFEDTVEIGDDIGGDTLFTLRYDGGATGYSTITAAVAANGTITATATRAGAGLATDVSNPVSSAVELVSSSAGDVGQVVTLFGLVAGVPTKSNSTLNGTSVIQNTTAWDAGKLFGAVITGTTTVGTVLVRMTGAGSTVFSMTAGVMSKGVFVGAFQYVNKTSLSFKLDSAGTTQTLVFGRNAGGGDVASVVTMTGTTPVVTAENTYFFVDYIIAGNTATARTLTMTAVAAATAPTVQTTLAKARDFFNAKSAVIAGPLTRGFTFTMVTGKTETLAADLDVVTAVDIKATAAAFKADLAAVIAWFNTNSSLVSAAASVTAATVPDNTSSAVFLSGGAEGSASFTDYQNALNLLKQVRVNSIVDLSGDPAVAAAVDAHCAYMGGIGRSERDAAVGLENGSGAVTTKTDIKAQIIDLNSRHVRAFAQTVERFNTQGVQTDFRPAFEGALAIGMQAGAAVGTSLTHKFINVIGFGQHSSWNPTDDAEELIQAGLCFMEDLDGVGRRWVRNITTHLATSNLAFVEASVNQAVNFAVYNFRSALEIAVGAPGFLGTVTAARGTAIGILSLLTPSVINGYRALDIELVSDVMDVSVEIAPIIPVNFVRSTVHLVTLAQLTAATAA